MAGSEMFSNLRDSQMKEAQGFILVFAVNSKISFHETMLFYERARRLRDAPSLLMILVGNKCDLSDREVTEEEGAMLASKFQCEYIECSAKDNIRI